MRLFSKILPLFICAFSLSAGLRAEPHAKTFKTDTEWPGIQMQVSEIKRIAKDRVVLLIRLEATSKAPAITLIGIVPVSAKGSGPQPFSLALSMLTDEQTEKKYPAVAPDPQAIASAPTEIMTQLSKGQAIMLSVEFQLPAPEEKDADVSKQTVTLKLPNSKSDIEHIAVPGLN